MKAFRVVVQCTYEEEPHSADGQRGGKRRARRGICSRNGRGVC